MSQGEAISAVGSSRRRTLAGDAAVVVGVLLATAAILAIAWATRAIIL